MLATKMPTDCGNPLDWTDGGWPTPGIKAGGQVLIGQIVAGCAGVATD